VPLERRGFVFLLVEWENLLVLFLFVFVGVDLVETLLFEGFFLSWESSDDVWLLWRESLDLFDLEWSLLCLGTGEGEGASEVSVVLQVWLLSVGM
jgi:hypothetical protein